jgi:hypothetical protein
MADAEFDRLVQEHLDRAAPAFQDRVATFMGAARDHTAAQAAAAAEAADSARANVDHQREVAQRLVDTAAEQAENAAAQAQAAQAEADNWAGFGEDALALARETVTAADLAAARLAAAGELAAGDTTVQAGVAKGQASAS